MSPFSSERIGLLFQRGKLLPPMSRFRCSAGQTGFFTLLGRLIKLKEKAKSDVEKIVSGFYKTRENLAVIDELLLFWKEILLVLDGNTGLNMLPQAREFNEVIGINGLILTKLDGSARGGCMVIVVDELGIPVKFFGVGEAVEDLQPFDLEAFVNAIFS